MNLWVLSDCTKTVFFWMGFFKQNGSKKTSPNGDQFLWPVNFTELKGRWEKNPIEIISLDASYDVKTKKKTAKNFT